MSTYVCRTAVERMSFVYTCADGHCNDGEDNYGLARSTSMSMDVMSAERVQEVISGLEAEE